MPSVKNMLAAAAGAAGGDPLSVEDVFATHTYYGNGGSGGFAQAINNGIDLSSEGGMVWVKSRVARSHTMMDTVRGTNSIIAPDTTGQAYSVGQYITYNTNGFSIHNQNNDNYSNENYCSWTFRKAPNFFDCLQFTGNGQDNRQIAHSLGQTPGMIIVLRTDTGEDKRVWHRSMDPSSPSNYHMSLNNDSQRTNDNTNFGSHSSTHFVVNNGTTNVSNGTYMAYLFAHNNNDGGFGPDGDKDIIKCGAVTDGSSDIDLGFEPQWLFIKPYTQQYNWMIFDSVRGFFTYESSSKYLKANLSDSEASVNINRLAYGFNNDLLNSSYPFIYVAIRKGPQRFPDVAAGTAQTNIFNIDTGSSSSFATPTFSANFKPEFLMNRENFTNSGQHQNLSTDFFRGQYVQSANNVSAQSNSYYYMDRMNGWHRGAQQSDDIAWMWKRAPGFLDILGYKSTNTAGQRIKHNLGVIPEMIWIKNWSRTSTDWVVFHKDLNGGTNAEDYVLTLNQSYAEANEPTVFGGHNSYYPTAVDFEVGKNIKSSEYSDRYMCWLFASLDGISKVGSYTGNGGTGNTGNTQDIDCGFSNGARFVMIKPRNANDSWLYFDNLRGIVAGNDPYMIFNDTQTQISNSDEIDPLSSGFTVVQRANGYTNLTGREYIFWAIAA
tara:strand:+ start:1641 stop:3617 length:1977 start_codon:yes stop_codon:yes gene_type:complete